MKLSRRDLFRAGGAAGIVGLVPWPTREAAAACQAFGAECPEIPPAFTFTPHEETTFRAAANRIIPPFDNGTVAFRGAGEEGAFGYVSQLLNAFNVPAGQAPRIYPAGRTADDELGTYIGSHGNPSECHGGHLVVPGDWIELPPEKEIGWRRAIARFQTIYRQGLAALDQGSQSNFGKRFIDLEPTQQTALLEYYDASNNVTRIGYVYTAGGGEPALESTFGGFTSEASLLLATLVIHTMEAIYGDPVYGGNQDRIGWKLVGFGGPRHPEGYYAEELETKASCDLGFPVNFGLVDNLIKSP